MHYPLSTGTNQVLVPAWYGVGSTCEPYKNWFALSQAKKPPQIFVYIHLRFPSNTTANLKHNNDINDIVSRLCESTLRHDESYPFLLLMIAMDGDYV